MERMKQCVANSAAIVRIKMHIDSENSLINIGIYGKRDGLIKSPRDT